jgi:hypothetical protein
MSDQPDENEIEIEEGEIVSDEEEELSMTEGEEEDEEEEEPDVFGLMTSLLATPEGDTICTALVNISNQLQVQNKILVKILSKLN